MKKLHRPTKDELETIHIRKRPDAPGIEPAYCGKTLGATITEAWGFWGPSGDGYERVCKDCVREYKQKNP